MINEVEPFAICWIDRGREVADGDGRFGTADQLKIVSRIVAELIASAEDVIDNTVNARPYPDGPCIDRDRRERLKTAIHDAKFGTSK